MNNTSNNNIIISSGDDKLVYYTEKYLMQYAKDNKDTLLQTKDGGIIVSNWSGWCTIVGTTNLIYHAWAGDLELQF